MIISNKRENPSICFTLQLEIFHKFVENLDKKAEQTFTLTITINSESHFIKNIQGNRSLDGYKAEVELADGVQLAFSAHVLGIFFFFERGNEI